MTRSVNNDERAREIAVRHVGSPMKPVVAAILEAIQRGDAEVAEVRRKLDVVARARLDAERDLALERAKNDELRACRGALDAMVDALPPEMVRAMLQKLEAR